MTKEEFSLPSTNGHSTLHGVLWMPEGEVKGIIQISHGMSEYVERYARFAEAAAAAGYVTAGNDHLGHGGSVAAQSELGSFPYAEKSKTVVADLAAVSGYVRERFPDKPLFLLGHSMGSFLARRYLMEYGRDLSGAVIMGTGSQPGAALTAGRAMATVIGKIRGERHVSNLLVGLSFGSYFKKIRSPRTKMDWLSVNTENVDKYLADPLCGFPFTVNGYKTLFDVIAYIQEPAHIRQLPKDVPLLFVSGAEDPVGHWGADPAAIAKTYREAGVASVEVKLYPHDRHEILNEDDHETVEADILAFIASCVK